jgi:cytolethal distending toxin subunit A
MLGWTVACLTLLSAASLVAQLGSGSVGAASASPPAGAISIEQAEDLAQRMVVMIDGKFGEDTTIGAGIVFDKRPDSLYIVTANHVVRRGTTEASDVRVRLLMLPGERLPAKLLDAFPDHDIAVLRVEGLSAFQRDLESLRLDRLGDVGAVKSRDEVYTIGQPNAKRWDVSAGGDRITRLDGEAFAFQSFAVAPGSSGGALFDAKRLLIGLVQKDAPPGAEALRVDVMTRVLQAEKYAVGWRRPAVDVSTPATAPSPVATAPAATDASPAGGRGRAPVPDDRAPAGRGRGGAPIDPTPEGRGRTAGRGAQGVPDSGVSVGSRIGSVLRAGGSTERLARPIEIVNANSGLCLTIAGGVTAANATAVQYTCDGDPSRSWTSSSADGAENLHFTNVNSGLCLTIAGGGTGRNATAVQYTCDTDPSRRWRTVRNSNGNYQIVNVNSGLCLTVAGGATGLNVPAVQYLCDGDPSRDWQLRPAR